MTQAQYANTKASPSGAIKALVRSDPHLKPFVKQIGELAVPKPQKFDLVDALARSILYQQLNGKAAETIVQRLLLRLGVKKFTGAALANISVEDFRTAGVSGNKAKALLSLAEADIAGQLPKTRQIAKMTNAALIDALVPLRGIGAWTVQMLLIFRLGREDVLPVDDFGVRKGVQIAHGLQAMPSAKDLTRLSESYWTNQQTLAALYFWRIADLHKKPALPASSSANRGSNE
jgi:DNA-3-methyladenine glycosylase II